MSNAKRTTITMTRATAALMASAGMLCAMGASAQDTEDPQGTTADVPATTPAPEGPPVPGAPAAAPPRPPQLPAPGPVYPTGYPFTAQPAHRPVAAQGPVFSWDPPRFAVAFESQSSWLVHDSAKRIAGHERTSAVGLSLQADVLRPRPGIAVRLDLAWVRSSATSYQAERSLSEQVETQRLSLGVAVRYEWLPYLSPFARVAAGLGHEKVTVADLHDRHYYGQGSVGAGLVLRSPGLRLSQGDRAPLLGLIAHLEGGYALASSSDIVLHADAPSSNAKPIPTSEVRLGRVERDAPYLRVSLGLAF